MEFELKNISVIYPDEESSIDRILRIRTDEGFLNFDFVDKVKRTGTMCLKKKEVEIIRDYLNIILKNKILED